MLKKPMPNIMMRVLVYSFFFLTLMLTSSCQTETDFNDLKRGTFELYENNNKVGTIYRYKNIQIEEYPDTEKLLKVKLTWIAFNKVLMSGLEENPSAIDTITWLSSYLKKGKNHYSFISRAAFIDTLSYRYKGEILKTSNSIPENIMSFLKK
ncbi:MAG: hypothetical protein GY756_02510 [bacterium]|nr:hypothetical protein [bacterium]